jgi:hypothetical protein
MLRSSPGERVEPRSRTTHNPGHARLDHAPCRIAATTDYDSAQDVVRMPMKASTAPSPQESFAIDISGSGNGGELRMSWDTFVWSIPLTVK